MTHSSFTVSKEAFLTQRILMPFHPDSGHGGTQADTDGDEADGTDETICPIDYETNGQIVDDVRTQPLPTLRPTLTWLLIHRNSTPSSLSPFLRDAG